MAAEYLGFRAIELNNGTVRAIITPDIGGRVLQFWLGEHPFLFVNPSLAGRLFSADKNTGDGTIASWKNYGGNKTWPAPQGWDGPDQWPGPPDAVLDSGRFATLAAGPLRVVVQSPPDPRTGLQITRELVLDARGAQARMRRTMRNVSDRTVRWSLWDVTQLECAARPRCWMTVPTNPRSQFEAGYKVLYGAVDNPQWRLLAPNSSHRTSAADFTAHPSDVAGGRIFGIHYAGALGKVGLDSLAGWVAFADPSGEWVFVHQFEPQPGGDYPDGGMSVEVWTHGPGIAAGVDFSQPQLRGEFMEMEVLSPLVHLEPGGTSSAELLWSACRCPGPILHVTALGCIGQPLTVTGARAQGAFGVFAAATARLLAQPSGHVLLEQDASPFEPLVLDRSVALPDGTQALNLVLAEPNGTPLGTLASAQPQRSGQTADPR